MPRKTVIDRLPRQVRELIGELREQGRTVDEILEKLRELDVTVARRTMARHVARIDAIGEKLKLQNEIVMALVREIKPAAVEGKTGRFLVQVLQKLVSDHLLAKLDDDAGAKTAAKDFHYLARTIREAMAAQKIEIEREVKAHELQAIVVKAAKAAGGAARKAGLSKKAIEAIERDVLGIAR